MYFQFHKSLNNYNLTLSFRSNRLCCRLRMDGFVSNECGLFLFLDDTIAAAAAIPTGPDRHKP